MTETKRKRNLEMKSIMIRELGRAGKNVNKMKDKYEKELTYLYQLQDSMTDTEERNFGKVGFESSLQEKFEHSISTSESIVRYWRRNWDEEDADDAVFSFEYLI